MQWSTRVANDCTVLTVCGPINRNDASRLKLLLSPGDMSAKVVMDMREVTFLGPSGLEVLADAAAQLANQPRLLAIVIGDRQPQVARAIADAHLQQTLRLFNTVEQALAARSAHGEPSLPG